MQQMNRLLEIMRTLRDPDRGCPWDRAQSFESIVPHTIEEAYEVAEAIEHGRFADLRDELGDLLFQVVFYAELAKEEGRFDFEDVAAGISEKMIRRHPHVFGDEYYADRNEQTAAWEKIKASERRTKGDSDGSVLSSVSKALPALTRAAKLQRKAAGVGFDWCDEQQVFAKIEEEVNELGDALHGQENRSRAAEELGDLLFSCVNLARWMDLDPEQVLRRASTKFERRFRCVEAHLRNHGVTPADSSLEEMDALWEACKSLEPGRARDGDGE